MEKNQPRLENPEFRNRVISHLLDVLIEHMTNPVNSFRYSDPNLIIDKIKLGEKIDNLSLTGPLVVAGQDLRLSPNEIDKLRELIFKNPPKKLADK